MKVFLLVLCILSAFQASTTDSVFDGTCNILIQMYNDIGVELDAKVQTLTNDILFSIDPKFIDSFKGPPSKLFNETAKNVTGAIDILNEYVNDFGSLTQQISDFLSNESVTTTVNNLKQTVAEAFLVNLGPYCEGHMSNVYKTETFMECYRKYEPAILEASRKANESVFALINGGHQKLQEDLNPIFQRASTFADNFSDNLDSFCGENDDCIVQYFVDNKGFVLGNVSLFTNESIAAGQALLTDYFPNGIKAIGNETDNTITCSADFCLKEA